jgi:pyruvate-formate lyase-activating enzyme
MELATLLGLRPIAGAGLLVTMTRRCPLHCAHCSTDSSLDSEQLAADQLRRFVGSITPDTAPDVVFFTGGEPLLRPDLLAELATMARRAGSATAVLTGGFFTRGGGIPVHIGRALVACDHISFSLDAYHEREVDRTDVFGCAAQLLDHGRSVSLHLLGNGPDDPYLADVTAEVIRTFGDQVPMLVSEVRPVGRASSWLVGQPATLDAAPQPCALATWPVVASDGTVLGCCNQQVVDTRPAPEHLRLGHVDTDGWPAIRNRLLDSPILRMVRTAGPLHLQARLDTGGSCSGYCDSCQQLSRQPGVVEHVARSAGGPAGALLDRQAGLLQQQAGAAALIRRYGSARYADLADPAAARTVGASS